MTELKKCPACNESYRPINTVDEDGNWTGEQEANCGCSLIGEAIQKEMRDPHTRNKNAVKQLFKTTCTWTAYSWAWESDCGGSFVFNDGGPKENNYKFCPYCGKDLATNYGL